MGIGSTLTWYGHDDLYFDGQVQANWYESTLNSFTLEKTLYDDNRGFGYAVSIEAGKDIDLRNGWVLSPQMQLIWSCCHL